MTGKIFGLFAAVAAAMVWAIVAPRYGLEDSFVSAVAAGAMALVIFLGIYFVGRDTKKPPSGTET